MATRRAAAADAAAIARIYNAGVEDRVATFETEPRSAKDIEAWLEEDVPLVVVEEDGEVVAWAVAQGIYRRHAQLDGEWRDCVIVERLLGDAAD